MVLFLLVYFSESGMAELIHFDNTDGKRIYTTENYVNTRQSGENAHGIKYGRLYVTYRICSIAYTAYSYRLLKLAVHYSKKRSNS